MPRPRSAARWRTECVDPIPPFPQPLIRHSFPSFLPPPRKPTMNRHPSPQRCVSFDTASITATIERALASAGLQHRQRAHARRHRDDPAARCRRPACTRHPRRHRRLGHRRGRPRSRCSSGRHRACARTPAAGSEPAAPGAVRHAPVPQPGRRPGVQALCAGVAAPSAPMPLVVMLHGCTQSPGRLRGRHADEPAGRGARLHRRLPRAGRQRQRLANAGTGSRRRTRCATAASPR